MPRVETGDTELTVTDDGEAEEDAVTAPAIEDEDVGTTLLWAEPEDTVLETAAEASDDVVTTDGAPSVLLEAELVPVAVPAEEIAAVDVALAEAD